MKKPKCKECNKSISRTIGFLWEASSVYYLNSKKKNIAERFQGEVFNKKDKRKNNNRDWRWLTQNYATGFYCNKCGAKFSEEETEEIKEYLKNDHRILKLQGNCFHKD